MSATPPNNNVPYSQLSAFYFFYFAGLGALIPYLSLYLQHLGLSAIQIGQVMGVLIGTKIIAPNFWGWLADRTHQQVRWIRLTTLASLFVMAGLGILNTFSAILLLILWFSFFWHGALPLFEAYTFRALQSQKTAYGRIRLWGSLGFIVAVMGVGWGIQAWGVQAFPLLLLAMLSGSIGVVLTLKEQPIPTTTAASDLSFVHILRQPWMLTLLAVSLMIQFSHGAYYSFYTIYLSDAGYSQSWIASLWALGVVAEIGVFFYMSSLLHRWSAWSLLQVSLLLTAIRWGMIAEGVESLTILLLAQLLHAASYGLFHAAAIYLIDAHFQGRHQAKGQALYAAISHGLGGGLGMLAAGYSWSHFGGSVTFLFSGGLVILTLFFMRLIK